MALKNLLTGKPTAAACRTELAKLDARIAELEARSIEIHPTRSKP